MLAIKGSQEFIRRLKKERVNIERKVAETHRRVIKHIFEDLVRVTPQYSGNLVSNWYIEFTGNKASYRQIPGYVEPHLFDFTPDAQKYQMGMDPMVSTTIEREIAKLPKIRYNTKVTIVNKAPYAEDVEHAIGPDDEFGNPRPIREENILEAYGGVAMKGYIEMKYSNLRYLKMLAQ